ncbi:MAG: hypothetical protein AB7U63_19120 [Porticoccaceae bacterium]
MLSAEVPFGHVGVTPPLHVHDDNKDPQVCWTQVGAVVELLPAVQVASWPAGQVKLVFCVPQVGAQTGLLLDEVPLGQVATLPLEQDQVDCRVPQVCCWQVGVPGLLSPLAQ